MGEMITPSLFVVEESQIASIPRPTGLEYLGYIMGSMAACHFRNYPSSQISITAGLFIRENAVTRSFVWRETSDIENPRPIILPSSREDEALWVVTGKKSNITKMRSITIPDISLSFLQTLANVRP